MIIIDFETRSKRKLGGTDAVSLHTYATDPSTDVTCLALKVTGKPPELWIPKKFDVDSESISDDRLDEYIDAMATHEFEAHNVGFELEIWHNVMHKRYGFRDLDLNLANCTMARAQAITLPASLKNLGDAVMASQRKDDQGHAVMLRLCAPVKVTAKNPDGFDNDPDKFRQLFKYCKQDVVAEECISGIIPELDDYEKQIHRHTLALNARGIPVDREGLQALLKIVDEHREALQSRIARLTNGTVTATTQRAKVKGYLESLGYYMESMTAGAVETALKDPELKGQARDLMVVYSEGSKTSIAKLEMMLDDSQHDGKIHNAMCYYTASTGRFSSQGCQVHNLPRTKIEDVNPYILDAFMGYKWFSLRHSNVLEVVSQCIRGLIMAPDGHTFVTRDYSAIEGRGLAWLSGDEKILQDYRDERDAYKIAACAIFKQYTYETVPDKIRQIGKVVELACGYQGGFNAFVSMEGAYHIDILKIIGDEELALAREVLEASGIAPSEAALKKVIVDKLVKAWRTNRSKTVQFWYRLEEAAMEATRNKGEIINCGRIAFQYIEEANKELDALTMILPSGRALSYPKAFIKKVESFGRFKDALHYYKINSVTKRMDVETTYGGKLAENATQALCRDILTESILSLEKNGFEVCFHVHDEIVALEKESDVTKERLEEFDRLMTTMPKWCKGFPLKVAGWEGKRYRK